VFIPKKDKKSFENLLTIPLNGIMIESQLKERRKKMLQISLAAARVNAGLKQEEAAGIIGVTAKTLRSYESGKTAIPGHVLLKVAKLYKISSDNIRLPHVKDGEFDEEEKNLRCSTV